MPFHADAYAPVRLCSFLLLLAVSITAAPRTIVSQQPLTPTTSHTPAATVAQRSGAEPPETSIRLLQADPTAHVSSEVVVLGTVVLSARRVVEGTPRSSFLLRDVGGETIEIIEPLELPPVGANVEVKGVVELLPTGIAVIGQPSLRPQVQVLAHPAGALERPLSPPASAGRCSNAPVGLLDRALCTVPESAGWRIGVPILILLLAAGALFLRSRKRVQGAGSIPLIVDLEAARKAPAPQRIGAPSSPVRQAQPRSTVGAESPMAMFAAFDNAAEEAHSTGRLRLSKIVAGGASVADAELEAGAAEGRVMQLLPGRLEVLEGEGLEPEIRFFRMYSQELPEITFGRSDGPEYRHVKLEEPTVSRLHARLRFADRRWKITNLSSLNPVVVNGEEMVAEKAEHTLADGDRIEIGKVVFRFRDSG